MSEHFVVVIPERAGAVPEPERVRRTVALLEAEGYEHQLEVLQHESLQLVHCGENFESIRCPSCGGDLLAWWPDAMSAAYDGTELRDLSCTTPCCGVTTTLHDLDYQGPQGFARFELHIRNGALDERLIALVADVLGMQIRTIHLML